MSRWLLDTNVISETRRPTPSAKVLQWIESLRLDQIFTSAVNIAELRYGALTAKDQLKQVEIAAWIEQLVKPWFSGRIVPADENVLLSWRILAQQRQQSKEMAPPVDLLIAAAAKIHDLKIATRDVEPFVLCGVPVLNPWTGKRYNGA